MRSRLLAPCLLGLACGQATPDPTEESPSAKAEASAAADAKAADQGPRCNADQAEALARALDAAEPRARPDVVTRGLADACQLPPYLVRYFETAQRLGPGGPPLKMPSPRRYQGALERACAQPSPLLATLESAPPAQTIATLFDHCQLERFGVVERDAYLRRQPSSLLPFVAAQWLLDHEVAEPAARTIAQAIELFDRREHGSLQPTPDLTPPVVTSGLDPVPLGTMVYVARDSLRTADEKLMTLDAGRLRTEAVENHLIGPLFDRLTEIAEEGKAAARARGETWEGRLIVAADDQTPYDTLVDVLYTAGRAEFSRYAFVADGGTFEYGVILADPPKVSAEPKLEPPALLVVVDSGGFEVSDQGALELTPERIGVRAAVGHDAWDFPALTSRAQRHRERHTEARAAIVSPRGDIPHGVVVRTYAALRGPDCVAQPTACVLPHVITASPGMTGDEARGGGSPLDPPPPEETGATEGPGTGRAVRGKRPAGRSLVPDEPDPDTDEIRRFVKAHAKDLRRCYERSLKRNPDLKGRVEVTFTVNKAGKVTRATATHSTAGLEEVGRCIERVVAGWRFPPLESKKRTITFPIVFEPG